MDDEDRGSEKKESAGDLTLGPIKQFGRYTLVKKLATGGMAEIWLARQTGVAGFNRFVVIKKILSHLAEEETFRNMFLDEARMSAMLTHPNIVQVYDLGEADSTYFIAMEFILGENLAAIAWRAVKRKLPLSPVFAARIIADASKALDYAHRLKGPTGQPMELVHRDISPQNILVTYEGEVKVVDFGIAKAATKSQHTKTGMLKGKFSYMSPEQCLGHDLDRRSDVFALGIVLYELCTGKRLFKHESELMILEMITKRRITPPSEVSDQVPAELEAIIMKALEKDVATRYASAQDLQIALEDFIRNQSEAATSADIAAYMRSLFPDKIDEKRRLCELASREDFGGAATFSEEPTQRAHPSQQSRSQQVMVGPASTGMVMPPHGQITPHPGLSQQQFMDPALLQALAYQTQQQALLQQQSAASAVPKVIIGVAVTVIALAGVYLATELAPSEQAMSDAVVRDAGEWFDPNGPKGPLALDSSPQGALIFVDGQPVRLGDGQQAKTPVLELTGLLYGKTYEIRLEKDGHEPFVTKVKMGPTIKSLDPIPKLTPFMGRVIVEISGEQDVTVSLNGTKVGTGLVNQRYPVGKVQIAAEKPGHSCAANPDVLTVAQDSTVRTTVRCEKRAGPVGGTRPAGVGGPVASKPPTPTAAPAPGGCATDANLPPGFATIDTSPPSQIFWNGKLIGDTPLARAKFPAGCIELVAKASGAEKSFKINVTPNGTQRYRMDIGK